MEITKAQARRFLLLYQGLIRPGEIDGKAGVLDYLHRVGCIQFDPLNIVGHNQELALQARVTGFRPQVLEDLLYEDRKLLDGLDKVMSIYPIEDWPYFRRRREAARRSPGLNKAAVRAVLPQVRSEIEARGPLSSLELAIDETIEWDWGTPSRLARAALDSLFFQGELVIHHKVHTRKYYDLVHRCLPAELLAAPEPNEIDEAYQDWYVLRRIGSVGLLWNRAGEAWLGMSDIKSKQRTAALKRLLERGKIGKVRVEGIKEPFYYRSQDEPYLNESLAMSAAHPRAILMAPLDNLLWDRRMLQELFDFEYRWEVYVPADKRRYGYYVLPVLYGDRFVARFDPGHDKKRGILTIKNWWWEGEVATSDNMKAELAQCFQRFLGFLGGERLEVAPQPREGAGLAWLADNVS